MPVTFQEFLETKKYFPSLTVVKNLGDEIHVISVNLRGVLGGGSAERVFYKALIDVHSFPVDLPSVFILSPSRQQIKHIDIYDSVYCPLTQSNLPCVSLGPLSHSWYEIPLKYRTLRAFLFAVSEILSHESCNPPTLN